jgi:hypothetical protein
MSARVACTKWKLAYAFLAISPSVVSSLRTRFEDSLAATSCFAVHVEKNEDILQQDDIRSVIGKKLNPGFCTRRLDAF